MPIQFTPTQKTTSPPAPLEASRPSLAPKSPHLQSSCCSANKGDFFLVAAFKTVGRFFANVAAFFWQLIRCCPSANPPPGNPLSFLNKEIVEAMLSGSFMIEGEGTNYVLKDLGSGKKLATLEVMLDNDKDLGILYREEEGAKEILSYTFDNKNLWFKNVISEELLPPADGPIPLVKILQLKEGGADLTVFFKGKLYEINNNNNIFSGDLPASLILQIHKHYPSALFNISSTQDLADLERNELQQNDQGLWFKPQ